MPTNHRRHQASYETNFIDQNTCSCTTSSKIRRSRPMTLKLNLSRGCIRPTRALHREITFGQVDSSSIYIYIPASPKAKFNEAFCNRPSLTRSFGLIEISPFSPHAHRRQAFRTLVLPKLQENLRNFAQSHMKNHSVLQKTQHVLKKKSTAVLAMRFFAHFSLIRAISSSKLMQVHKD